MKKNLFFLLIFCIITFSLLGCNKNFNELKQNETNSNEKKQNNTNEISMSIKDGTLTRTSATIIITDISEKNNLFSAEYKIEKNENNEWKEVKKIFNGNYGWNSIGYSVNKDNKLEMELDWNELYGELPNGEYRIVKATSAKTEKDKYFFYTEFQIN